MNNNKNITPTVLRKMLSTKQAKEWGYKSEADAKKHGYNTKRFSCDMKEIRSMLNITHEEAEYMVTEWQMNGLVNRVSHADLNCIYFK